VIRVIRVIRVLLPKNREGVLPCNNKTPLNKKGEQLAIALITPIASSQTLISQGNQEAIAA